VIGRDSVRRSGAQLRKRVSADAPRSPRVRHGSFHVSTRAAPSDSIAGRREIKMLGRCYPTPSRGEISCPYFDKTSFDVQVEAGTANEFLANSRIAHLYTHKPVGARLNRHRTRMREHRLHGAGHHVTGSAPRRGTITPAGVRPRFIFEIR
jgi:hypothetical protein